MKLRKLTVRNFMVHEETTIDLKPITVLVGANGAGKSALFDAYLNFSTVSRGKVGQAFSYFPFSFQATLFRGASSAGRISYEAEFAEDWQSEEGLLYKIEFAESRNVGGESEFMITNETLTDKLSSGVLFDRAAPNKSELGKMLLLAPDRGLFAAVRNLSAFDEVDAIDVRIRELSQIISRVSKYRMDPWKLSSPSQLPEIGDPENPGQPPRLGYTGEYLPSVLFYLSEALPNDLDRVISKIKSVIPEVVGFEFNVVGSDKVGFSVKFSDQRGLVPATRLSSGILMMIGLFTLTASPSRTPLILVEEPENGLTPKAVKAFYRAIVELATGDSNPQSQVILSSHSPWVLCEAWNGEERDFIYQVSVRDGRSIVLPFHEAVKQFGGHLAKGPTGIRTELSLKHAEAIMCGHMSP